MGKSFNRLIGLGIIVFLFFTFSNFNNVSDIVEAIKESVDTTRFENPVFENTENIQKAVITDVVDGDTIKVYFDGKEETVRLLLIDTPETVKPNTPVQPFGEEASDYMKRRLIKDTVVELEFGIEERDKYNRLLAYVFKDGDFINEELVKEGLARVAYVYEPNTKYLDVLKQAENEAQKKKIGIWSIDGYVTDKGFNYE